MEGLELEDVENNTGSVVVAKLVSEIGTFSFLKNNICCFTF